MLGIVSCICTGVIVMNETFISLYELTTPPQAKAKHNGSTVAFHTLGCKVNFYDTEAVASLFERAGYTIVDFQKQADVYVINTCSVTNMGARKSRQVIR